MAADYRHKESVTVDTAVADSQEVTWESAANGTVYVPAGSSLTTLTYHVSEQSGGTFLPLYNGGTAVTQTVVHTRAYQLPSQLDGCGAFKITGNAAGTVHISLRE